MKKETGKGWSVWCCAVCCCLLLVRSCVVSCYPLVCLCG